MIPGITASRGGQPDGPTDWNTIPDEAFPGGGSSNWQYLSSNPNTGTIVLSGLGGKFFRSTDYGETWNILAPPGGEANFLRIGGWVTGNNWIAQGNANATYMTSSDDGATWTSRTWPFTPSGLSPIYPDPFTPGRVYAVNSSRLFVSTDSGVTFSATPLVTFSTTFVPVISPVDGTILALFNGQNVNPIVPSRFAVSTNQGASWTTPQTLMADGTTYNNGVFNGAQWVIGAPGTPGKPLKYSTDLATWTDIPGVNVSSWDMAYNDVDGSTVVVGDANITPMSSRESILTWVNSPVSPVPPGVNPLYLNLTAAGDYWMAAGSAVIRAPRAR